MKIKVQKPSSNKKNVNINLIKNISARICAGCVGKGEAKPYKRERSNENKGSTNLNSPTILSRKWILKLRQLSTKSASVENENKRREEFAENAQLRQKIKDMENLLVQVNFASYTYLFF